MSASPGTLNLPRAGLGRARVWIGIAAIAGAVVVAMLTQLDRGGEIAGAAAPSSQTTESSTMERLVNQGLVPAEALEPTALERLVNEGLVPAGTLQPNRVAPLYSASEQAVMAAVASGQVPADTLDGDVFLIKRLVDQGLIPRETVGP